MSPGVWQFKTYPYISGLLALATQIVAGSFIVCSTTPNISTLLKILLASQQLPHHCRLELHLEWYTTAHLLHCSLHTSSAHTSSSTAVSGLHLAGDHDSAPEAAAAEQAVKRARQSGAEGASGAVFAALEAAEAQHNRQQQGKHVCLCPPCHAHPLSRPCMLKKIDSYQHTCCTVLCCAALCCAVQCAMLCLLCCINRQHNNDIVGQMSMAFISPTFICLCMYFMIYLFVHLLVYLSPSPSQVSHLCMWLSTTAVQVCMPPSSIEH